MNLDPSVVVFVLTIFINFIAFVRIFTKLESRLKALEVTLAATEETMKFISNHLITLGLADRRGGK